jgi:hypothetical protein
MGRIRHEDVSDVRDALSRFRSARSVIQHPKVGMKYLKYLEDPTRSSDLKLQRLPQSSPERK